MDNLTIHLGIIILIIIPLAYLMLKPQIKELLGKDNGKRFICPRCGKKSQVGMYSRETHEFVCPDCADKEEKGGK